MNKKYLISLMLMLFCLAALVVAEVLLVESHPHFKYEEFPAFYGVIGFVSFVVLVFGAKYLLRPVVSRPEGFIDKCLENPIKNSREDASE